MNCDSNSSQIFPCTTPTHSLLLMNLDLISALLYEDMAMLITWASPTVSFWNLEWSGSRLIWSGLSCGTADSLYPQASAWQVYRQCCKVLLSRSCELSKYSPLKVSNLALDYCMLCSVQIRNLCNHKIEVCAFSESRNCIPVSRLHSVQSQSHNTSAQSWGFASCCFHKWETSLYKNWKWMVIYSVGLSMVFRLYSGPSLAL